MSGSVSIQIAWKITSSNKIDKTIGAAKTKREEELLMLLAKTLPAERLHCVVKYHRKEFVRWQLQFLDIVQLTKRLIESGNENRTLQVI